MSRSNKVTICNIYCVKEVLILTVDKYGFTIGVKGTLIEFNLLSTVCPYVIGITGNVELTVIEGLAGSVEEYSTIESTIIVFHVTAVCKTVIRPTVSSPIEGHIVEGDACTVHTNVILATVELNTVNSTCNGDALSGRNSVCACLEDYYLIARLCCCECICKSCVVGIADLCCTALKSAVNIDLGICRIITAPNDVGNVLFSTAGSNSALVEVESVISIIAGEDVRNIYEFTFFECCSAYSTPNVNVTVFECGTCCIKLAKISAQSYTTINLTTNEVKLHAGSGIEVDRPLGSFKSTSFECNCSILSSVAVTECIAFSCCSSKGTILNQTGTGKIRATCAIYKVDILNLVVSTLNRRNTVESYITNTDHGNILLVDYQGCIVCALVDFQLGAVGYSRDCVCNIFVSNAVNTCNIGSALNTVCAVAVILGDKSCCAVFFCKSRLEGTSGNESICGVAVANDTIKCTAADGNSVLGHSCGSNTVKCKVTIEGTISNTNGQLLCTTLIDDINCKVVVCIIGSNCTAGDIKCNCGSISGVNVNSVAILAEDLAAGYVKSCLSRVTIGPVEDTNCCLSCSKLTTVYSSCAACIIVKCIASAANRGILYCTAVNGNCTIVTDGVACVSIACAGSCRIKGDLTVSDRILNCEVTVVLDESSGCAGSIGHRDCLAVEVKSNLISCCNFDALCKDDVRKNDYCLTVCSRNCFCKGCIVCVTYLSNSNHIAGRNIFVRKNGCAICCVVGLIRGDNAFCTADERVVGSVDRCTLGVQRFFVCFVLIFELVVCQNVLGSVVGLNHAVAFAVNFNGRAGHSYLAAIGPECVLIILGAIDRTIRNSGVAAYTDTLFEGYIFKCTINVVLIHKLVCCGEICSLVSKSNVLEGYTLEIGNAAANDRQLSIRSYTFNCNVLTKINDSVRETCGQFYFTADFVSNVICTFSQGSCYCFIHCWNINFILIKSHSCNC